MSERRMEAVLPDFSWPGDIKPLNTRWGKSQNKLGYDTITTSKFTLAYDKSLLLDHAKNPATVLLVVPKYSQVL